MKDETLLAQVGSRWDDRTWAISVPIYQTATYCHPSTVLFDGIGTCSTQGAWP